MNLLPRLTLRIWIFRVAAMEIMRKKYKELKVGCGGVIVEYVEVWATPIARVNGQYNFNAM